jgi:chaperonin cofactor prefoldin
VGRCRRWCRSENQAADRPGTAPGTGRALSPKQASPELVGQLERRVEFLEQTVRSINLEIKDIKRVLEELKG